MERNKVVSICGLPFASIILLGMYGDVLGRRDIYLDLASDDAQLRAIKPFCSAKS